MKKLVFHIGAHKTGSTLLQNILESTKNQLQGFSIRIADYGESVKTSVMLRDNSPLSSAHVESLRTLYNKNYKYIPEQTVVVSSESFVGNPFKVYENSHLVAQDARKVFQDFDVRVLVFVRRQDTFYESLYHQAIKQGSSCTFDEFKAETDPQGFKWDELVAHFAESFGKENLTVIPYEHFFRDQDTIAFRFFKLLGLELKGLQFKVGVANPSLSQKGLEVARRCNPILDEMEKRKLRGFLQAHFPKKLNDDFGLFSPEERQELLEFYEPSNQRLFKEYISGYDVAPYVGASDSPVLSPVATNLR